LTGQRVRLAPETVKMLLQISSREVWLCAAAVSAFFLSAWPGRAQAMSPAKPATIIVEKMTFEAQWRHRHHQLRRRSRQQLNDEQRAGHRGDQSGTYGIKK
jgi:hypothetical protein